VWSCLFLSLSGQKKQCMQDLNVRMSRHAFVVSSPYFLSFHITTLSILSHHAQLDCSSSTMSILQILLAARKKVYSSTTPALFSAVPAIVECNEGRARSARRSLAKRLRVTDVRTLTLLFERSIGGFRRGKTVQRWFPTNPSHNQPFAQHLSTLSHYRQAYLLTTILVKHTNNLVNT
jgi:hypothetical protein